MSKAPQKYRVHEMTPLRRKGPQGFTIAEMMIVSAIIGLLCAIVIPNFIKMRSDTYKNVCITNLRGIAAAKEHWSMETGAADTDAPTAAQLDKYIKDGTAALVCPIDSAKTFSTSYTINSMSAKPVCRIQPGSHVLP